MFITSWFCQAVAVTLNMVVLFRWVLALGMLVDNGIVIVENIYRHVQQGKPRTQASQRSNGSGGMAGHHLDNDYFGRFCSPPLAGQRIMGEFMVFPAPDRHPIPTRSFWWRL